MAYSETVNVAGTECVMDEIRSIAVSVLTGMLLLGGNMSSAHAAGYDYSYGVGISFLEDGAAIYLPVNLGDHWRLEPVISLERSESNSENADEFQRETAIGAGIFHLRSLSEPSKLYVGLRALSVRRDEMERQDWLYQETHRLDARYRGYQVNVLVGVDFFFADSFSVGGEAGLEYTEVDVTFTDSMMGRDEVTASDTRTRSNLVARYYF